MYLGLVVWVEGEHHVEILFWLRLQAVGVVELLQSRLRICFWSLYLLMPCCSEWQCRILQISVHRTCFSSPAQSLAAAPCCVLPSFSSCWQYDTRSSMAPSLTSTSVAYLILEVILSQ